MSGPSHMKSYNKIECHLGHGGVHDLKCRAGGRGPGRGAVEPPCFFSGQGCLVKGYLATHSCFPLLLVSAPARAPVHK